MFLAKLPSVRPRTKKTQRRKPESHLVFHRSLFKQKKTDGPRKILKTDPCDSVLLPEIDDRAFNAQKRLQVNRDDYLKICDRLELERKLYVGRKEDLSEQWDMLEMSEMYFKNTMLFYNQFVKENIVKRERFRENLRHYMRLSEKYIEETETMKKSIGELEQVIATMKEQINKHQLYQDFLEQLVSPSDEFKSVSSLVTRFELLFYTSKEITKSLELKKLKLEHFVQEFAKRQFEHRNTMQSLMNQLGRLHEAYVKAQTKTNEKDELVRAVKIQTLRRSKSFSYTEETMYNLYLSICRRQGVQPCYAREDYNNQLLIINTEMTFLETILGMQEEKED